MNILKKILPFFFVFFFLSAKGQSIETYFENTYEAEEALLDSNYLKAAQYYQKAFTIDQNVLFLKDVHNALLAANLAKDTSSFFYFADLIVSFDIQDFIPTYEDKIKPYYFNYLNSLESTFQEITGHCNFFKKLKALDQGLRKACIEEGVYPICIEEIRILDSVNLQSILRYLNNHGLIPEVNRCNLHPTHFSPLHLVVLHNSSTDELWIFDYLLEELQNGKIHPQEYAYLIGRFEQGKPRSIKAYGTLQEHIVIMDRLFIFNPNEDKINEYNLNRQSIFLDNLDQFHRKLTYQFFHPDMFYFVYPWLIQRLGGEGDYQRELIEKFKDFEKTSFEK